MAEEQLLDNLNRIVNLNRIMENPRVIDNQDQNELPNRNQNENINQHNLGNANAQQFNGFRSIQNLLNETVQNSLQYLREGTREIGEQLREIVRPIVEQGINRQNIENLDQQNGQEQNMVLEQPRQEAILTFLDRDRFERVLEKITIFDGKSDESLKRFIATASIADGKVDTDWKRELFTEELVRKVPIDAVTVVKHYSGENWREVAHILNEKYEHFHKSGTVLKSQIENLKQKPKESISEFAERARNLVQSRCSLYSSRDMHDEINSTAAKAFKRGLANAKFREIALNRATNSLETSIRDVLEIESDNQAAGIPTEDQYCRYCKRTGHTIANCLKKPKEGDDVARVTGILSALNLNFQGGNNQNRNNTRNQYQNNGQNQNQNGNNYRRNNGYQNQGQNQGQNQNSNSNNRGRGWNGQRNNSNGQRNGYNNGQQSQQNGQQNDFNRGQQNQYPRPQQNTFPPNPYGQTLYNQNAFAHPQNSYIPGMNPVQHIVPPFQPQQQFQLQPQNQFATQPNNFHEQGN